MIACTSRQATRLLASGIATLLLGVTLALVPSANADGAAVNPWLERRVLGIAHAGGEVEHPHSTLFAFDQALADGVHLIDLDLQMTADGVPVVLHDPTVDRTTDGTGAVGAMTFAEVNALDAAYWYAADCWACTGLPAEDYLFRGMRTGDRTDLPAGAVPDDFGVPSLRQVFERYPDTFVNMEIKTNGAHVPELIDAVAALIAEFDRADRTVVAAFDQGTIDRFRSIAPDVATSATLNEVAAFLLNGTVPDGPLILDVPPEYTLNDVTFEILTADFVARAHAAGLAVWVWPNDRSLEQTDGYAWMLDLGVDGINAAAPSVLMDLLRARGVAWDPTAPPTTTTTIPAATTVPRSPAPSAEPVAATPAYTG